jgi:hypothetical protein
MNISIEKYHLFPNVYRAIKDYTPKTVWYQNPDEIKWDFIHKEFSRFMIKDYVKSVKGSSFPKYFTASDNNDNMDDTVSDFIKLRGSLYTGGIVLKEYVDFKKYGDFTNEYRAFYLNGQMVSVSRNSNQSDKCLTAPIDLVEKFSNLKSNFYTVDFGELNDGRWIVIETGDAQVSGLSPNQYIFKFYDEMRRISSNT